MTDSPTTRQSLLVRLKDPKVGQAWGEFVAIYASLIDRLAPAKEFQEADAADLAQDVFRAVAGAIDRLLAKDPADRFRTAAEVADLLERGLAHVQQPTTVPRPLIAPAGRCADRRVQAPCEF